jgi:hypothetical protein
MSAPIAWPSSHRLLFRTSNAAALHRAGDDDEEYPLWHAQRKIMSKIFFKDNFKGFIHKVWKRR